MDKVSCVNACQVAMPGWTWVLRAAALAVHEQQIAEHGGGHGLRASDAELVVIVLALAAAELSEDELAAWFREHPEGSSK